jgi:hypothetical protein
LIYLTENKHDSSLTIIQNNLTLGKLIYKITRDKQSLFASSIHITDTTVVVDLGSAIISDTLSEKDDQIVIDRKWQINKPGKWKLHCLFEIADDSLKNWVVPAVMYDENRRGQGHYPKGGLNIGWAFREDRMPIPSCSILHNDKTFISLHCDPADKEKDLSSIKTFQSEGRTFFDIQIPYSEEPKTYREKGLFLGGLAGKRESLYSLKKQDLPLNYSRRFYLNCREDLVNPAFIFKYLSEKALDGYPPHSEKKFPLNWSRIADLKLNHIQFLIHNDPKRGVFGLKMGKGNGFFQLWYGKLIASFLGRNIEAATILARMDTGQEKFLNQAEQIGRFFVKGAQDNGGFYDSYNLKKHIWESYCGPDPEKKLSTGFNTRSTGEAMLYFLRLDSLLKSQGREIPEIHTMVKKTVRFFLDHQLKGEDAGSYGRWWSREGELVDGETSNGAHIIPFLIEYEKLFGKSEEITASLIKAAEYYGLMIENNDFYGDTLDADCVDKEAAMILLRSFMDLYEHLGNPDYLDKAKIAASYILGWTWTYNVPFSPDSKAAQQGIQTLGLTSVSVGHHHLDFIGLYSAYDFLRLWKASGEESWKTYAHLLMDACSQLIATETNKLGRSKDFLGWQPEQINHTNWDYAHHWLGSKGDFRFCDAWVVVLTLGSMLDIRQRFPEELSFTLER